MSDRQKDNEDDFWEINPQGEFHDPREPPLGMGDVVRLDRGGVRMLVVDVDAHGVITAAFKNRDGEIDEITLPAFAFHRAPVLDD